MSEENSTNKTSNSSSDSNERILLVSSGTNVSKLAASITMAYKEDPTKQICLQYIGAGACNQAVKAVILANKFLQNIGRVCNVIPVSYTIKENGSEVIVFRFLLSMRLLTY